MKAFLANLTSRNWLLLAAGGVALGYPLVRVLLPAVFNALVPEVVRNVLRVI